MSKQPGPVSRALRGRLSTACLAGSLALGLLVQPVLATWSVVVTNMRTGEVAVGCATCLDNFNLIPEVPVIYPGVGVGASQSVLDTSGARRKAMWDGFEAGLTPTEILANLALIPGHKQRQYGIVDLLATPETFTGSQAGQGKDGVTGVVGDYRYAIQGNLLVGSAPVLAAEQALLNTPGDLGQKLMAAMEAAQAMGGDGRCSCSNSNPTSCGEPPPGTWKSAHTGFMILSRTGDKLGQCSGNAGCANGKYYMKLNSVGTASDPDPVFDLRGKFDAWRAALAGRPDHVNSVVSTGAQQLVADGVSAMDVHVQLVDVDGVPLTTGGASLTLTNLSGSADATTPGPVTDNGDGTYLFTLTAGTVAGQDDWELKFNDGVGNVRLYPRLSVPVAPVTPLASGYHTVSAGTGAAVPLVANFSAAAAGRRYVIVASAAGTWPGTVFDGGVLPLNRDFLLGWSVTSANQPPFLGTRGNLDAIGRAEALFMPTARQLTPYVGARLDWSAVAFSGLGAAIAPPVGFDVVP